MPDKPNDEEAKSPPRGVSFQAAADDVSEGIDRGYGALGAASAAAAATNGEPRDSLAAVANELARRQAAGEPEAISPITEAYFKGFGHDLGIADKIAEQWAAQLPDFTKFAQGLGAAIEGEGVGFKFMDDKFLDSIRGALDRAEAPFKFNLAQEALAGFKFDELTKQIQDKASASLGIVSSPSLFIDPTPTDDLDIVRATIDAPDEPTTIEEVPAEVVTDIHVARTVIREEIVEALNEAFENRQPKRYWTLERVAALVGMVIGGLALVAAIVAILVTIGPG